MDLMTAISATQTIKALATLVAPKTFFHFQMRGKSHEPEVRLVPTLLEPGGVAVDVGANEGLYVYHLQKRAQSVFAFEPFEHLARNLKRKANSNVTVHCVALSDRSGETELRYPVGYRSWATVEASNTLRRVDQARLRTVQVPLRTLDSYAMRRLDLLKIDVEGHEFAVLAGAIETLRICRPNVIVEVEEVHKPRSLSRIQEFFHRLEYRGYFLDNGSLRPLEEFRLETDQAVENVGVTGKTGRYINHFIFLSSDRASELTRRALDAIRTMAP